MNNAYYKLYLADVINLARTLVIKSEDTAQAINAGLKEFGIPIDEDKPWTWKYYLNTAGEYHPTDTIMQVRSVDTLETIDFTKANLRIHRATAREYRFGSRFYRDLVRRYPDQTALINGVLSPVPIDDAINASDGTILDLDHTLREPNETNLISGLQDWVYNFFSRWNNNQYTLVDDLYTASFLGILYSHLPGVILTLRLRNAKTPYAHSFHIREYLASHGRLDAFMPYLSTKQQLWLYRNIRYLERNVGRQDTFDDLVDNILTPRGLPLAWYKLQHNVEDMPDNIYPEVELAKYPVNFGFNQSGRDVTSVHTILERERSIARDNPTVQEEAEEQVPLLTRRDSHSELPTKVLESEVVDRSNSSVRNLESVLINEWVHLATTDRYNTFVNVPNPGTGEYMVISVRDAFIIALYAISKLQEVEMDTIPRVMAYDVLRSPLPAQDELLSIIDTKYLSQDVVMGIQDHITPLGEYITTERFHTDCRRLHKEYIKLWELYSLQEHYLSRGYAEQVVRRHFMHVRCSLVDETISFEQWFKEKGYGVADLGRLDLEQLYTDCVVAATGADLTTEITLSELQKALLRLMGRLSSYSVQYLRTINQEDFWFVGMVATRLGDQSGSFQQKARTLPSKVTVLGLDGQRSARHKLNGLATQPPVHISAQRRSRYRINPWVNAVYRPQQVMSVGLNASNVGVRSMKVEITTPAPDDDQLGQY